jgi:hypothetical protein
MPYGWTLGPGQAEVMARGSAAVDLGAMRRHLSGRVQIRSRECNWVPLTLPARLPLWLSL